MTRKRKYETIKNNMKLYFKNVLNVKIIKIKT